MPKKTTAPQSPDSLRGIAVWLRKSADLLDTHAEILDIEGFGTLTVKNDDQRRRGTAYLDNYTAAVRSALREAKEVRGDFQAVESTDQPPVSDSKKRPPKKREK